MTVKLMKATDEENLESFKEKKKKTHLHRREQKYQLPTTSQQKHRAEYSEMIAFKCHMKTTYCSCRITYGAKITFMNKSEMKAF